MAGAANTVSLSTNFNSSPYYDDFDESKNFHRIIFRPGQGVQARELTQMQTILQNQIDRFAEHVFREGSPVRGCEVAPLDTKYDYVKLRDSDNDGASVNVYSFQDKIIKGSTSGVLGLVVNVNDGSQANTPDFKTFFVNYVSSNTSTGYKVFANNEVLTAVDTPTLKANTITAIQGGATGYGSAITVKSGIVFAKDHFIRVDQQTLILDKYSSTPSYRVGYNVVESIVTSTDDSSLLDPASGAFNFAAPGANRLKLTPTLTKKESTDTSTNNFVEFVNIKNGVIQTKSDVPQYSAIRDELAKRTKEESGNYIVRGLFTRVREHLNDLTNQGVYTAAQGGNTQQLSIDVEPGKAYVEGYDNELIVTQHVPIDKGIDYLDINDAVTYADFGNYVIVDNFVGSWDLDGQNLVSLRGRASGSAQANAVSNRSYSSTTAPGSQIGTARVRGVELHSGTPGAPSAQYRLYLGDIRITTAGKSFANVECLYYDANTGFSDGFADILGSNNKNANTVDSAFRAAIIRLPAKAVRRVRDSSNTVDTDFGFWKTIHVSFDTSGQGVLTLTGDETFSGSGALSSLLARDRFHVISRTAANTSTLTGTVSVTSGSNTITGSGSAFTTQLNVGDLLRVGNTGSTTYQVSAIASDTSLSVLNAPGSTKTGVGYWKEFKAGQLFDVAGVGRDGARSVTVDSPTQVTIDLNETTSGGFNATVLCKAQKTNVQEAGKTINRDRLVQIKMGASGTTGYTANTTGPWPLGLTDGFRLVSVRQKTGTFSSATDGTDVTTHFYLDNGQRDSHYDHARLVKKPTSQLSIGASDRLLVQVDYFTWTNRDRGYFSIDSYPVNDATAGANSQVIYTYQIPVYTSPTTGLAFDLRDSLDFRPRLTDTANSVTTLTNISTNPLGIDSPVYSVSSPDYVEPTGGLRFPYSQTPVTVDLSYYLGRKDLIVMDKNGKCESIRGTSSPNPVTPKIDSDKMTLAVVDVTPYPSLPDEIARRANRGDLANKLTAVKNERFTMRDIGVIRDRVERLEYYTTLSLLEKEAKDINIRDSSGIDRFKNGFLVDGFNGHGVGNVYDPDYKIAVDPARKEARPSTKIDNIELFYNAANSSNIVRTNVTTANVSRDQLFTISNSQISITNGSSITISSTTATVRYKFDNKLYVENATGNFAAAMTGGSIGSASITSVTPNIPGNLLTLPYTHDKVINQPFAATTRNTSGLFYNWVGVITLKPSSDYWIDTVSLPDVQINIDNSVDNFEQLQNSFGTQWGSWETIASGVPVLQSSQLISDRLIGWESRGVPRVELINLETYTQGATQQRLGTTMGISLSTQTQTIGEVVRDVNIQPFMRSRIIRVKAEGLKPSSRIYSFFDSIDVTNYITPTNSSFANTANEGGALYTNSSGVAYAIFRVPNESALRFRTGEKIFRMSDSPTNSSVQGQVTTSAQATFASQGLRVSTQDLTVATTHAEITQSTVIEQQNITQTFQRENIRIANNFDPIAQTFYVDAGAQCQIDTNGVFVTKVDLYFATKDSVQPVIVELREVDQMTGYPTPRVVPYGRAIVQSSSVNISDDSSKPTPIYFPSPVFLQDKKSYAIAVIPGGGNPNYSCWISRLGDNDLISGNRIATQPAAGILFASSNDRTYTALQEEDLKFAVYYAKFNVATTGSLVMKNEDRDFFTVANVSGVDGYNVAGEWVHGETYIKGTLAPSNGLVGNVASGNSYVQGMTSSAFGKVRYISTANGDMRVSDVTGAFLGGEALRFRLNSSTGTVMGNTTGGIKFAQYPKGRMSFYDAVTSSNSYLHLANVSYSNSGPSAGTAANNRMFTTNRWLKGQSTGVTAKISTFYSLNADLLNVKGDFITPSNTSVTPSAKFATSATTRDSTFMNITLNRDTYFSTRRYIHSKSIEANTAASSAAMKDKSAEVKFAFVSRNNYTSPVFDTSRISTTIVENLINNSTVNEANTTSGGYADAKYITRKVILDEGQDAEDLLVYLDAYKPPGSDVTVYYKVLHREDSDTFAKARWIQMSQVTSNTSFSSSEDLENFNEYQYAVPNYPTGSGQFHSGLFSNSSPTKILSYRNSVGAFYVGFKYFAIKIVLTGTNTTNPPRIKNLRAIALQK